MNLTNHYWDKRRKAKEERSQKDKEEFIKASFKEAISSEINESTQKVPKGNKEQLVHYWRAITVLSNTETLTKAQIKEIILKYTFTEPTHLEIQNKLMLAQIVFIELCNIPKQTITTTEEPVFQHDNHLNTTTKEIKVIHVESVGSKINNLLKDKFSSTEPRESSIYKYLDF